MAALAHFLQFSPPVASYWKSTAVASAGMLLSAALLPFAVQLGMLSVIAAAIILFACALVAAGGLIVICRDAADRQGRQDLFQRRFNRVPASNVIGWRRWIRPLLGASLRPGDLVRVRSADEIRATLDTTGRLEGLPFMPEMLDACGRVFVVDRRIDKINDWIGGNRLRRTKGIVTLVGLRCSGARHGSCQAACQILWKERWLARVPAAAAAAAVPVPGDFEAELVDAAATQVVGQRVRYMCQTTELVRASHPLRTHDIRQDLRPLLNGNIGLAGFGVALLTRLFNKFQSLRGGVGYPLTAPQLPQGPTPKHVLALEPGEWVRVRDKYAIGRTLHKNHNRGMWFGAETLRFCGHRYRVRSRVERLIHEHSGEMIELATPGVILESVTGTGEFLRFCPQNEYVFWREIWLERVEGGAPAVGARL